MHNLSRVFNVSRLNLSLFAVFQTSSEPLKLKINNSMMSLAGHSEAGLSKVQCPKNPEFIYWEGGCGVSNLACKTQTP